MPYFHYKKQPADKIPGCFFFPDKSKDYQLSLHNIEIFEGLSALDQARLLGRMEKSNFPPGSILFRQENESDGMYVIQSGKVKIYTQTGGNTNVLALLQDGEYFGEMALLTGEPKKKPSHTGRDVQS